jgi:hypothetical protein
MKVAVHFGAHKTATTFLQDFLRSKKGELRKHGIGYVPLHVSRKAFFPALVRLTKESDPGRTEMIRANMRRQVLASVRANAADLPPLRLLLLSDENLAGSLAGLWKTGKLYDEGITRLKLVSSLFPESEFSYFFCVRDYADFCVSSYCEVLRHRKLGAFEDLMSQVTNEALRWPEFLARMSRELGAGSLSFWRFEDFLEHPAEVVEALTTQDLQGVREAMGKTVRPSLSRKAIEILMSVQHCVTEKEHVKLANMLAERFEFEDNGGKLKIANPERTKELKSLYMEDMDKLMKASSEGIGIVRRLK